MLNSIKFEVLDDALNDQPAKLSIFKTAEPSLCSDKLRVCNTFHSECRLLLPASVERILRFWQDFTMPLAANSTPLLHNAFQCGCLCACGGAFYSFIILFPYFFCFFDFFHLYFHNTLLSPSSGSVPFRAHRAEPKITGDVSPSYSYLVRSSLTSISTSS